MFLLCRVPFPIVVVPALRAGSRISSCSSGTPLPEAKSLPVVPALRAGSLILIPETLFPFRHRVAELQKKPVVAELQPKTLRIPL